MFHILADANAVVAGGEIAIGLVTKTPLMVAAGLSIGLTGGVTVYLKNSLERKIGETSDKLDHHEEEKIHN